MPATSRIVKEKDGCLIQNTELRDRRYCIKIKEQSFFHDQSQEGNDKNVTATGKYRKLKMAVEFYEL